MISKPLQVKIAKFITNTLPVGRNMERRHMWKESFCPRCGKDSENSFHILQCDNASAREILKKGIEDMCKVLSKLNTETELHLQLIHETTIWLTQGNSHTTTDMVLPIKKQKSLGWNHFMEGRIHCEFEKYMDEHYTSVNSKKNGEMWVSVVIQTIWTKIFLPLWKHRNAAVHIINDKTKKSREHLNLNFSIRQIYTEAQKDNLLFKDRYLIEEPISQLLRSTTARKRGWILTTQQALRTSVKAKIQETTSMQNSMRLFQTTGTCRVCDITPPPVFEKRKPKKRVKRNPYRKHIRLLQPSGRKRSTPETNTENTPKRKKVKRNKTRKTIRRCPTRTGGKLSHTETLLPTIEEEWEFANHVRKK